MRILLARHGETPWNAEGRYQGQIDIPLSPVGEAQAKALGERLVNVDITRAVASPLVRTMKPVEAFRATALSCLQQLQRNEPGVIAGESPEYVHQARVAMRRLRSALARKARGSSGAGVSAKVS